MTRTIQAVTRPLYASGTTEWLGLTSSTEQNSPGIRVSCQHEICLPNPGYELPAYQKKKKKSFLQGGEPWLPCPKQVSSKSHEFKSPPREQINTVPTKPLNKQCSAKSQRRPITLVTRLLILVRGHHFLCKAIPNHTDVLERFS